MADASRLAYKAYEIEEFVDIYFYRRAGYAVALAARQAALSPNMVSVLAGVVGALGGGLIAWPDLAPWGVGLLVLHGVIDSADGQLARMTGRTSEFGRVLDGAAGYATHIALYLGIFASIRSDWGTSLSLAFVALSGLCTAIQAQMYDYHRTAYAGYAIQGRVPRELEAPASVGAFAPLVRAYIATQRSLLGLHRNVEQTIQARTVGGAVREVDRELYRACFYRRVRGWNVLGDNVRRYVIAICVWQHHPEWFVVITLGPLNVALLGLWWYQLAADRRFLAAPAPASSGE